MSEWSDHKFQRFSYIAITAVVAIAATLVVTVMAINVKNRGNNESINSSKVETVRLELEKEKVHACAETDNPPLCIAAIR